MKKFVSPVAARVQNAFENSDQGYLAKCLMQRQPGEGGAGSRFLESMTLERIRDAEWEEYSHPAVKLPANAFRAPIAGRFGMVRLADLPAGTEVRLDDRKGVGQVTPAVVGALGPEVGFTTLLIGPDEGKEVVWTFFPGEPIPPSTVETKEYPHGTKVPVEVALSLGLEWAKIE